ncbi:MAG: conjugal transfer protein TraF [Pseudomonadales bacterium]|nr:conjugal transfer protein TraF [Pseudomonadales bacterium]
MKILRSLHRLNLLLLTVVFSGGVSAGSSGVNSGGSLTTGPSSSAHSMSAAFNNPAMNSLVMPEDDLWRMSFLPNIGYSMELGQLDNFSEDLDDLIDIIDNSSATTESTDEVLERFNEVLAEMGESGYLKQSFSLNAPILPLYHRSALLGGTVGVTLTVEAQVALRILDDTLAFNNQRSSFDTATSLYLKSGIEKTVAMSYSRRLLSNSNLISSKSRLYAGLKLKFISLDLSKQIMQLQELGGKDISDVISSEYDENLESNSNVGIDLGFVFDADRYRIGFIFENLNSPEFDYGAVGENCTSRLENTAARTSCENAANFIQAKGDLNAREVHTKNPLARIDGLYRLFSQWYVSSSIELATYNDITGFDNQWWHAALSYESFRFALPSIRVGYAKNLAGFKTSSLNFGVTAFNILSFDLEYGLDSVEVDGSSLPRRLSFTFGMEESF